MESGLHFEVQLRSMKLAPFVGPRGSFARRVDFRVRSLELQKTKIVDGGLVGEETLRRCELLRDLGAQVVTVTDEWMDHHQHGNWLADVVDMALQQVADRNYN